MVNILHHLFIKCCNFHQTLIYSKVKKIKNFNCIKKHVGLIQLYSSFPTFCIDLNYQLSCDELTYSAQTNVAELR
jgi:hypothetical protein